MRSFPLDFRIRVCGFVFIQSISKARLMMSAEEILAAVSIPVDPKGVQWCWCQASVRDTGVLLLQLWKTVSSWTSLSAQGHGHVGTGLDLLRLLKGNRNDTGHEDVLYNCVLALWQHFDDGLHVGVMLICPQSFFVMEFYRAKWSAMRKKIYPKYKNIHTHLSDSIRSV